jgi:tRNA nucleotidyltransferase/poly(A) polymerase
MRGPDDNAPSPYAGRWVARLQGRIIAHGGTPEAALRAAQASRHKERPEISFIPADPALVFSPLVHRVAQVAQDQNVYLVGGAVRDALRGGVSHDFDFSLPKDAIQLARRVAGALGADFYILDESFDAGRVIVQQPAGGPRDVLDFSAFRAPDLEADLAGRDFTINAMAVNLRDWTVMDPCNGVSDLRTRWIRACSATAMEDDPIRVLRAVRLAAALDFRIESETRRAMKRAVSFLPAVSTERRRDELFKILDGARVDTALRALELLGVFPYLLPELSALKGGKQSAPHVYDVWEHTLSVIQSLERILGTLAPGGEEGGATGILPSLLRLGLGRYEEQLAAHLSRPLNPDRTLRALLLFAALYHDVAKPATRSTDENGRIHFLGHDQEGARLAADRGRAFNLSSDEIARVHTVIENHLRLSFLANRMATEGTPPSGRAIHRFFRDAGEAGVDLVLLGLADEMGTRGTTLTAESWTVFVDVGRVLLENFWEKPAQAVAPRALVDGQVVMDEYGLVQGPQVGEVLEAIREAQAAGEVGSREEALAFGRRWLTERRGGELGAGADP